MNDDQRIILHISKSLFVEIYFHAIVKHFPQPRYLPSLDVFLSLLETLDLCPSLNAIYEFEACRFAEDV
jgi:hypothetical protein